MPTSVPRATRTHSRAVRTAGLAALLCMLAAALFATKVSRKMPDLEVYWKAAVRARAAEPLYRASDQHYQFKYLPAFAVLAMPAGALTLRSAKAIWFVASMALIVALAALSLPLLPERRRPAWLLVTITILAMAKFLAHELVLGQVNVFLALLVVLAALAARRSREVGLGILVTLAIVVKPYAVIFLPWLLARGRARSITAAGVSFAAVLVLPALVYGWGGNLAQHEAWWRTVTTSTAPNLTNADNVSLAAMFAKWMGPGAAASAFAVVTAVVVLTLAAFVVLRRGQVTSPEGLEAALLLTCIPLLSPQGWDYVFLVSAPAVMFLVNYGDLLPGPLRWLTGAALATIAFSVYDLMGREAYAAFMSLSVITLCFLVILTALGALRARGVA